MGLQHRDHALKLIHYKVDSAPGDDHGEVRRMHTIQEMSTLY